MPLKPIYHLFAFTFKGVFEVIQSRFQVTIIKSTGEK